MRSISNITGPCIYGSLFLYPNFIITIKFYKNSLKNFIWDSTSPVNTKQVLLYT